LIWGITLHADGSAEGIEWEMNKSYLLRRGPFAVSRNPMYLAELIFLVGWIIFYGSIALVIALIA
jgi:protein-S-isoprenylcysteine O-methyltransferase Ste14